MGIWSLLFLGLGVAMFLEGLPYFVSPPSVRRTIAALSKISDGGMRMLGLALITVGLIVAYISLT